MSTRALEESVALVTGATSGIGLATAHALAARGCRVVLSGRRLELGEAAAGEIREDNGDAVFIEADVTDDEQVQALVDRVVDRCGRLDIAFNNAGIEGDPLTPLHESSIETFDRVFDTNVRAVFRCMQLEIRHMLDGGGGAIVNNASVAGVIGFPGAATYCGSKHAVIGMTKSAALEYGEQGIRVNAVAPAVIETGMFERVVEHSQEMLDYARTLHAVGRFGRAEEVAQAVVWLVSPENSFTTGVTLPVDGGFTAR